MDKPVKEPYNQNKGQAKIGELPLPRFQAPGKPSKEPLPTAEGQDVDTRDLLDDLSTKPEDIRSESRTSGTYGSKKEGEAGDPTNTNNYQLSPTLTEREAPSTKQDNPLTKEDDAAPDVEASITNQNSPFTKEDAPAAKKTEIKNLSEKISQALGDLEKQTPSGNVQTLAKNFGGSTYNKKLGNLIQRAVIAWSKVGETVISKANKQGLGSLYATILNFQETSFQKEDYRKLKEGFEILDSVLKSLDRDRYICNGKKEEQKENQISLADLGSLERAVEVFSKIFGDSSLNSRALRTHFLGLSNFSSNSPGL